MGMTIKYPVNNEYFDKWSANMSYILGFTITDGCLHHRPGNRKSTLVYNIKDKEILEFIRQEISPTRYIENKIYKENIKYNISYRTGYSLRIPMNDEAVSKLDELGIMARKTGKEICPEIPKEYFGDYLRGVFDGDGSIYIANRKSHGPIRLTFTIVSKCKKFLEDINTHINNIGYIYYTKSKDIYRLQICKQEDIRSIYDLMYKNHSFHLHRKKDIFDKVIKL